MDQCESPYEIVIVAIFKVPPKMLPLATTGSASLATTIQVEQAVEGNAASISAFTQTAQKVTERQPQF